MILIYNFLSTIALILYMPLLLLKKGPESKAVFLQERLGRAEYKRTDIWVHAVSVGETIACIPFLKKMKEAFPDKSITLSTTTYTGQKIARDRFPEADRIMYMPWDSSLCINRVVRDIDPDIFITIETEIWPALIKKLKASGSKIILLNGRISHGSFKGYKRAGFFMKRVLSLMDHIYMQSKDNAERIISIGAKPEKVEIMGNFKFDISFNSSAPLEWINNIKGRILLAGSTHKGEDEIILRAFEGLHKNFPDLKLIIAPRHPERFDEVENLIRERGFKYIKRSEIKGPEEISEPVILMDTIGELPRSFVSSTVTFIGGSLLPYGGHNILEPAYWSIPVIFGPHMDNFPVHREFLEESAAILVKDPSDIITNVSSLLNDPEKAKDMGMRGKAIVANNTGAVDKAVDLIRRCLGAI